MSDLRSGIIMAVKKKILISGNQQSNPTQPTVRPNPTHFHRRKFRTQPNQWMNPTHGHVWSKSMHVFLSKLANRQTNERGQTHLPPPVSEVTPELWGYNGWQWYTYDGDKKYIHVYVHFWKKLLY